MNLVHTRDYDLTAMSSSSKNDLIKREMNYVDSNMSINQPMSLTWTNVNVYSVKKPGLLSPLSKKSPSIDDTKNIISNVDGLAKAKEILAIMGASGAGKTTLLNVLNFRNRGKLKINGEIRVNGHLIKSLDDISVISAYVQQDDLFAGYLTVKEHLLFLAMLRMDKNISKENKLKRVDEVIHELNLKKCQDMIISVYGRKGISGGEKRRLAFASEIITNPSILFCDEPTSGLDSFMALSIAECMRDLAKKGKTIICTIHQPSSELFEMFDKLCLLSEGRLAYFGDLLGATEFFRTQNMILPPNYNPADFFIKKLGIIPSKRETCLETIDRVCTSFEKSDLKTELKSQIEAINDKEPSENERSVVDEIKYRKNFLYKTSFPTQMKWLLWRNSQRLLRDFFSMQIQIGQTFVVGVLFGLIYLRLNYDQQGIMDMNGLLFLCICNNGFATMFFVVNTFPIELPLFYREYENGMYKVLPYYLSKIIVDLPSFVILPFVFMSIVYWMANLNNDVGRFFICAAIIILVVQCSLAFGTFLSSISPSTNVALALAGPVLVPLMIFSGYLLNYDSIPKYFIWLRYLSWFGYANQVLVVNQWHDVELGQCPPNSTFCFSNGDQLITYLKIDKNLFVPNILCLIGLMFMWRIITYIVLLIKARLQR